VALDAPGVEVVGTYRVVNSISANGYPGNSLDDSYGSQLPAFSGEGVIICAPGDPGATNTGSVN